MPQRNVFRLDSNIMTPRHSIRKRTVTSLLLEQIKSLSFGYSVMLQTYKLTQYFVYFLVIYIMQPFLASRAVKEGFKNI